MSRKTSPNDVKDFEWLLLLPLVLAAKMDKHPQSAAMREIVDAIFSVIRSAWVCVADAAPTIFRRRRGNGG